LENWNNNHYMTPAVREIDGKIFLDRLRAEKYFSGYFRAKGLYTLSI